MPGTQKVEEFVKADDRREEMRDLSDAFACLMESVSEPAERKIGVHRFLKKILRHIPAEECAVYLPESGTAALRRAHSTSCLEEVNPERPVSAPILESVLATGTLYLNNHWAHSAPETGAETASILCLPLDHRGGTLGVLEILHCRDHAFTGRDVELAGILSRQLAVGLVTIRRFEHAERLTITDDLTKLYNYRYLMQYLESEVRRCLRYKKKVSLLFIDIDGFKKINDTFGHLIGSQALSELGQVFRQILREADVVGRYGGDEFVIVLPETPLSGALLIAERIRKQVEDYEFFAQNLSMRLTVSLGVANCPKHTLTAEGLIKKADAAMYRAKELTKNSIKVAV
jgi:diguanylate cyclase (GGDEF)-like protein